MKEFRITGREAGQRMDKYLLRMLNAASPGFVYKMLRKKNILLNGAKAAGPEILREGDEIRLYLSDETFDKFAPAYAKGADAEGSGLEIVYEDDDILILNKPSGLLSQKAGPDDDSANDRVIAYLLESGQITPEQLRTFHPSICNRLDRNTSGLLIAGKTMRGLQETAELLKGRELKKYYHALVRGSVEEAGHLRGYLTKDEGANTVRIAEEAGEDADPVETAYRPLAHYGNATLLEAELLTGRTHQIRAHFASMGHPVLGDPKYGDRALNGALTRETGIRGQLLCACRLEFPDGRVVKIPDPESFRTAEEWMERR